MNAREGSCLRRAKFTFHKVSRENEVLEQSLQTDRGRWAMTVQAQTAEPPTCQIFLLRTNFFWNTLKKKKKLLIGRHWSVAQSWISQRPDNRQLHKHTASLQDFHDQGAWTQTALNAFSGREKEARGCFQDDAIVTALFPRVQHGLLCLVALKYYTVNTEKTQKFCDVQKQSHIIDTKVAKLRDYNTTIWVLGPLTSSTRPTPPDRKSVV